MSYRGSFNAFVGRPNARAGYSDFSKHPTCSCLHVAWWIGRFSRWSGVKCSKSLNICPSIEWVLLSLPSAFIRDNLLFSIQNHIGAFVRQFCRISEFLFQVEVIKKGHKVTFVGVWKCIFERTNTISTTIQQYDPIHSIRSIPGGRVAKLEYWNPFWNRRMDSFHSIRQYECQNINYFDLVLAPAITRLINYFGQFVLYSSVVLPYWFWTLYL